MAEILTYRGTVQNWHCDHMGHMNVMWYVGKFDEGTWNLFAEIGLTPAYMREASGGMAAVRQTITYKREALVGDVVAVRTRLLEVGRSSITFHHAMSNAATGELLAECEIVACHIARVARASAPLPQAVAERARALRAPA